MYIYIYIFSFVYLPKLIAVLKYFGHILCSHCIPLWLYDLYAFLEIKANSKGNAVDVAIIHTARRTLTWRTRLCHSPWCGKWWTFVELVRLLIGLTVDLFLFAPTHSHSYTLLVIISRSTYTHAYVCVCVSVCVCTCIVILYRCCPCCCAILSFSFIFFMTQFRGCLPPVALVLNVFW